MNFQRRDYVYANERRRRPDERCRVAAVGVTSGPLAGAMLPEHADCSRCAVTDLGGSPPRTAARRTLDTVALRRRRTAVTAIVCKHATQRNARDVVTFQSINQVYYAPAMIG